MSVFARQLLRFRENVARRHDARRPVVVTGPAETTALRTAARDFNQEAIAHLGLRRKDGGRRREDFIALQLRNDVVLLASNGAAQTAFFRIFRGDGATDARRHAFFSRRVGVHRSVFVVADDVKRRHVKAAALSRQRQQQFFFRFVFENRVDQLRPENLAFADANHIGEVGDRFGIQERRRAAHHDQRIVLGSVFRPDRHAAHLQHARHVDVISLKRDRERDDVELANWRLRLERKQRRPRAFIFREFVDLLQVFVV